MNRQDPKSLREIIEEALSMTGMTDDFNRRRLSALWPEVVGPAINRGRLEKRTLIQPRLPHRRSQPRRRR